MDYREFRSRLSSSETADEARSVMREYAGERNIIYDGDADELLMIQFVRTICRLNGTHWTSELID